MRREGCSRHLLACLDDGPTIGRLLSESTREPQVCSRPTVGRWQTRIVMPTPSPFPVHIITTQIDWGSIAEWATAAVALAALVVSAIAFFQARATERRLGFIAFEERLQTRALSEGRREIYQVNSERDVRRLRRRSGRWDSANHAINLWNNLAQYARSGLIERKLASGQWGDTVVEAWPHLEHFIRYRRRSRKDKWSSLVWFAEQAGARASADLLP